jgi:hypothetical protein
MLFKNFDRILKKTLCVTVTKLTQVTLFRKIMILVYTVNYTKGINTLLGKMAEC